MSSFAALNGFDGDAADLLAKRKKKEQADAEAREREAAATRARFDAIKNAGASNWADSDDEDDDAFFQSAPLPVTVLCFGIHAVTFHLPSHELFCAMRGAEANHSFACADDEWRRPWGRGHGRGCRGR